MIIRPETEKDFDAIYNLVRDSFAGASHTDGDEQNLVTRLRNSPAYVPELALVAEIDGKIVGHIMFTTAKLGNYRALNLAPVAVAPDKQKMGIGGALIRRGHEIAKQAGYDYIALVGHSGYYPRFGYIRANTLGIKSDLDVPDDAFMAIDLKSQGATTGANLQYPREFFEK